MHTHKPHIYYVYEYMLKQQNEEENQKKKQENPWSEYRTIIINELIMSIYYMPGTLLVPLHVLSQFFSSSGHIHIY